MAEIGGMMAFFLGISLISIIGAFFAQQKHASFSPNKKCYLMLPSYFFPHLLLPMLQSAVVTAGTYVVVDVADPLLRLVLLKTERD